MTDKFSGNPTGKGPSTGIKTVSIGHGQRIMSAYPQDNVSGVDLPDTMGCKLGGGVNNLSHSLSGASTVKTRR